MGQGALKERSFTFCFNTTFTQGEKKKKICRRQKQGEIVSFVLCSVVNNFIYFIEFCGL